MASLSENGTTKKNSPGNLLYKVELRGEGLLVRLEEKNSRRVLYLDTLQSIAVEADKEPLAFLIQLHLKTTRNPETLNFQRIEVPSIQRQKALQLMEKTGRMIGNFPKKQVEAPLQVRPKLILQDASGSLANLFMDYEIDEVAFEDFVPTVKGRARLKKEEVEFEKDLLESGFTRKRVGNAHYYCRSEKVKEALSLLIDVGWQVFDFQNRKVVKQGKSEIAIEEREGIIKVKGHVQFGEDRLELAEMLKSRMWVSLGENRVGLIDKNIELDRLEMKKSQIGALLPLLDSAQWEKSLKDAAVQLQNGLCIEQVPPSPNFQGELLNYQRKGVDFLFFLYKYGFSALLADEMGLGKTVQVLAFLSHLGTNLPVLIVAPTSLLFNWKNEIDRFLPKASNIALISYTTLRLKAEEFAKTDYEVIVLDESSAIKTAATQTAKAAFNLRGKFKICLNGTPMENRFDELRSQFHFLLPDLIEKGTCLESVKRKIKPFILRRKKEDVQLDLPEKIEQIAWVEMSEEQLQLYETYRRGFKADGATRMEILEAILRLRQICNDPRLLGHELMGAKYELIVSNVLEAVEDGRKILVYSQFTSMLKLLQKEFTSALYLDGSTPSEERGELVRQFQEDPSASIFLLSLKAGGVGLNLTAADYVFLVDPWWNEAVERQAIDRAHRIGQKKTVIAKRYLVCGSIEEKMLQLKGKKQQAADQLLDFEGGAWDTTDLLELLT